MPVHIHILNIGRGRVKREWRESEESDRERINKGNNTET